VTVKLKRDDIGLIISLVTQEIGRVVEARERWGFCNPSCFYRLLGMRNKLLAIPVTEKPPVGFSEKEWKGFMGKRLK